MTNKAHGGLGKGLGALLKDTKVTPAKDKVQELAVGDVQANRHQPRKEFDEAAAIDGAGPVRRFVSIKLPLMGRTFAFVAIMTMANYFQMFAQFQVFAPDGGRSNSAMVLTNYIYKTCIHQLTVMSLAESLALNFDIRQMLPLQSTRVLPES